MKISAISFSTFPIDFQKDTMQEISDVIKRRESLQLVAPTGAGNSMIAKALIQLPEFKKKYFGIEKLEFVLLDGNLLLERSSLNLSRLLLSLLNSNNEVSSDAVLIQTKIEEKILEICNKGKLIVIIDHIDEINFPELRSFFNNLANIYRNIEPAMQFIFLTQKQLKKTGEIINFGKMANMMTQNFIFTSCLNKEDSFWFIEEKEKQIGLKLNDCQKEIVFKLTGGFPRTIKRLVEAVGRGKRLDVIKADPGIDIPISLHLEEIASYPGMAEKIPLLNIYLTKKTQKSGERVGEITLGYKLTKIEGKILKVFVKYKGEIVDREKGIEAVWGENAQGISDHAYDQIVHRLRKKLENSSPKVEIETVRGRGHTLNFLMLQ